MTDCQIEALSIDFSNAPQGGLTYLGDECSVCPYGIEGYGVHQLNPADPPIYRCDQLPTSADGVNLALMYPELRSSDCTCQCYLTILQDQLDAMPGTCVDDILPCPYSKDVCVAA
jgi:hypothetical protein